MKWIEYHNEMAFLHTWSETINKPVCYGRVTLKKAAQISDYWRKHGQ